MRLVSAYISALAVTLFYSGYAWSDSWKAALTSRISEEFDSNPGLSQSQHQGVWRTLLDPGFSFAGKIAEHEIAAGLALQVSRSSNKTLSPDRDSPTVFLNWIRPGDTGEFAISSRYAEMATRDSGGADSTVRVPVTSTRASRTLSGKWSDELSERSTIAVDGTYDGVTYKGGAYGDYSTRVGGARLGYIVSERVATFIRVSGSRYVPATGNASSNLVEALLGMSWRGEYMDWTIQAGKSRFGGGGADTQGSFETHYTGQRAQLNLSVGRTVAPSGLGGFVRADMVRGGWTYPISEYSNTGVDLERRKNLPTPTSAANTSNSSGIWMDRNIASALVLRAYFQRRSVGGVGANSYSDMIGLSILYSNFDF